jgi:hypothetical protein
MGPTITKNSSRMIKRKPHEDISMKLLKARVIEKKILMIRKIRYITIKNLLNYTPEITEKRNQ